MTACRNKASRAVTAALVGVLSVGAVPMVALAQTGATTGGAQLMLGEETLAGGKITEAYDDNNDPVALDGTYTIPYDGEDHFVKPTKVESAVTGHELKVGEDNVHWGTYKEMPDGDLVPISGNGVSWPGTYYAVAYVGSDMTFDKCATVKFTIVMDSLDDAYICDGTDADDKVIEFDGTDQLFSQDKLSVAVDGEVIPYSEIGSGNITVYKDGDSTPTPVYAHDAGKYVARVTYNKTTKDIPFEIVPLDVTKAELKLNNGGLNALVSAGLPTQVTEINGVPTSQMTDAEDDVTFTLTYQDGVAPAPANVTKGEYDYTLTVKDEKGNVKGEQDVTVTRYVNPATFEYEDGAFPAATGTSAVTRFDESLIEVRGDKKLDHTVAYYKNTKSDGSGEWKPVDKSATTGVGLYKAVVTAVDPTFTYGGTKEMQFQVKGEPVQDADVYLLYKGEIVNSNFSDIYNGEDFLDDFTLKAYDEDGELIDGSNFVISATKDKKAVDSVVDAGTYTIEVKVADGSKYVIDGSDTSLEFVVEQVKALQTFDADDTTGGWHTSADGSANATLRLAGAPTLFGKANTYAYTGEAVTPTFEYDLTTGDYKDETVWVSLPSDAYRVSYQKSEKGKWVDVEECVEPGTYQVKLVDNKREDNYKVNYVLGFTISDDDVFVDVDPDAYYAESVYQANKQGYVYGMGGTNMFAPNASMSRADMAVMLFRMAGGELRVNDGKFDVDMGYVTKFEDCDENAYYAKAVAWATQVGIVSGYDATHFGPADKVTTEQFAVMLANYAKAAGKYEKVDVDATLAEVSDGASVSAFAREQVAWAVDNGYIAMGGAAISPQAEISRGRVVTIAVRYQPEVSSIVAEKPGDSNLPGNESGNKDQKN